MSLIWIIFIGIVLLSYIVQVNLNHKFKKFSKIPLAGGMTGRDVAEKISAKTGINAAPSAPSPKSLRKRFGIRNAITKALCKVLVPKNAPSTSPAPNRIHG